jgi:gluconate 2-dehydrogenase gamma chain
MSISRRTALKALGAAPVAAGLTWTSADAAQAHQHAAAARTAAATGKGTFKPKFFTAHEWATVRLLVDLIIPKDERSGSATDAGVPEFMDFMMIDRRERQVAMRGGLMWLDTESLGRFGRTFVDAASAERTAILDDLAWPKRARPELTQGVAFFSSFRDLTASGFWTSKMGIEDLQYIGNVANPDWNGCPPEALERLGVRG